MLIYNSPSPYLSFNFKLVLVFSLLSLNRLTLAQSTCYNTQFPRVFGGNTNGDTQFNAIKYISSSEDFLIGGSSSDSQVVTSTSTPNAFVLYISKGGNIKYSVLFDQANYDSVVAIEIISSSKFVVALYPFAIAVVSTSYGNINEMYTDSLATQSITQVDGMVFDNDEVLHVAMTSNTGRFLMLGINVDEEEFEYYVRTDTGPSYANSVVINQDGRHALYGGLIRSSAKSTSYFAGIVHLKVSGSFQIAFYGYEQITSGTKYMVLTRMAYNAGTDYFYAVFEQNMVDNVSPQVRMRIIMADFTSPTSGPSGVRAYDVPVLSSSGSALSNIYKCITLKLLGSSSIVAIVFDVNLGDYYLLSIPLSSGSITLSFTFIKLDFFPSGQRIYHASILSQSQIYYTGASDSIIKTPSYSNPYKFGYIMTLDYSKSCYSTVTHATQSGSLSLVSGFTFDSFTDGYISPTSPSNLDDPSPSQTYVPFTKVLPAFGACQPTPLAAITSTLTNQYFEQSSGTQYYTFPIFTADITSCTNTAFNYEIYGTLPPGASFDRSFRKFTINTSLIAVGTYLVNVRAILTNTQSLIASFDLTIYPSCASAVFSSPLISDNNYYLSQPTLSIIPSPLFAVSPSICPLSVQMTVRQGSYSGSVLTAHPFTFNSVTQEVRVYTTLAADIREYYVTIKGFITTSTANSLSKNFIIRVISECEITQILPIGMTDYFMTAPNTNYPNFELIQTINWGRSISTCTEPMYYSVSKTVVTGATPYQTEFNISIPSTIAVSPAQIGARIQLNMAVLEQYLITVVA